MSWYREEDVHGRTFGDAGTVPVSALVPIRATAASRPLRRLAKVLVVSGVACMVLSLVGASIRIVVVSTSVDFARRDIVSATDRKNDKIFFDLDREAGNIRLVLSLAGMGVGAVGVALGAVIAVIGGMARQLDRTLAPVDAVPQSGSVPMAAVAYPSSIGGGAGPAGAGR